MCACVRMCRIHTHTSAHLHRLRRSLACARCGPRWTDGGHKFFALSSSNARSRIYICVRVHAHADLPWRLARAPPPNDAFSPWSHRRRCRLRATTTLARRSAMGFVLASPLPRVTSSYPLLPCSRRGTLKSAAVVVARRFPPTTTATATATTRMQDAESENSKNERGAGDADAPALSAAASRGRSANLPDSNSSQQQPPPDQRTGSRMRSGSSSGATPKRREYLDGDQSFRYVAGNRGGVDVWLVVAILAFVIPIMGVAWALHSGVVDPSRY